MSLQITREFIWARRTVHFELNCIIDLNATHALNPTKKLTDLYKVCVYTFMIVKL